MSFETSLLEDVIRAQLGRSAAPAEMAAELLRFLAGELAGYGAGAGRTPDRQRILELEARVGDLLAERAALMGEDAEALAEEAEATRLLHLADRLRPALVRAGGDPGHARPCARLLLHMLGVGERVCSKRGLLIALGGDRRELEPGLKMVDVILCSTRKALRAEGFGAAIQTLRFSGWVIRRDAAEALRAHFGIADG